MATKPLPSPEVLRQLLRYEPETGKLFWKERSPEWFAQDWRCRQWNARYARQETFNTVYGKKGYLQGCIHSVAYMAHRVVYCLHFGDPGIFQIDHLNGDRADNRLENLRCVTGGENSKNRGLYRNNSSGRIGVYFDNNAKMWRASIKARGHTHHLGCFLAFEDACAARAAAEKDHGFHANHGNRPGYN